MPDSSVGGRVLERGGRLLSRQIGEYRSELVDAHFARIGMQVLCSEPAGA
jgi:hypothetical protein